MIERGRRGRCRCSAARSWGALDRVRTRPCPWSFRRPVWERRPGILLVRRASTMIVSYPAGTERRAVPVRCGRGRCRPTDQRGGHPFGCLDRDRRLALTAFARRRRRRGIGWAAAAARDVRPARAAKTRDAQQVPRCSAASGRRSSPGTDRRRGSAGSSRRRRGRDDPRGASWASAVGEALLFVALLVLRASTLKDTRGLMTMAIGSFTGRRSAPAQRAGAR